MGAERGERMVGDGGVKARDVDGWYVVPIRVRV